LDVDQLPSGAPFIVMEFLEGHDLAGELRDGKTIPHGEAVRVVLQACEAIAEAHAGGIVHRDLKPANLFLARGASGATTVKVLDFGISKITRREAGADITANKALTNPTSMLGSPLYMSPEQMKASTEVDARTDIWSLGVILYEAITGRSPFDAKTIPMICAAVLSQDPAPFDVPEVPPSLERVVRRCLEKDAAKRYRDVAHFVRALTPFAPEQAALTLERITRLRDDQGLPVASPASLPPPPSKEGSLTITSWGEKPAKEPLRRWWPIWAAGAAVVAIGGGVLWRLTREDPVVVVPPSAEAPAAATSTPSAPVASPPSAAVVTEASPASAAPAVPDSSAAPLASASTSSRPAGAFRPGAGRLPTAKPSSGRTAGFGGRE
jgi:serine/threonine-protein kinase